MTDKVSYDDCQDSDLPGIPMAAGLLLALMCLSGIGLLLLLAALR